MSAIIDFDAIASDTPIEPLSVHYLRLDDLTTSGLETIQGSISNHLADKLPDYEIAPDTSDPESISFTIHDSDATLYRAAVTLTSRSLEPRIDCEQWGSSDIAHHLGISTVTVRAYLSRGQMPEPDGYISGTPWWDAERIRNWERPRSRRLR